MNHLSQAQAAILLVSAIVTFVSYQMIPGDFEEIARRGKSGAVTLSVEFTLFVRACGVHHLIMALFMALPVLSVIMVPQAYMWVVVGSEASVAFISALSASVIRHAARG